GPWQARGMVLLDTGPQAADLGPPAQTQRRGRLYPGRLCRRPRPGGGPRHAGGGSLGAAPAPGLSRRALHTPARPDLSPARWAAHRGALCAGGVLALAGAVPLYQPDLPPARGGVLRLPLSLCA